MTKFFRWLMWLMPHADLRLSLITWIIYVMSLQWIWWLFPAVLHWWWIVVFPALFFIAAAITVPLDRWFATVRTRLSR